eukprot:SAG31_NODE_1272_length_9064_cov_5.201004_1_plen_59_part_10
MLVYYCLIKFRYMTHVYIIYKVSIVDLNLVDSTINYLIRYMYCGNDIVPPPPPTFGGPL